MDDYAPTAGDIAALKRENAELRKRVERLEAALLYLAGTVQPTFAFDNIQGNVRDMLVRP
jgi:hypothetical protein